MSAVTLDAVRELVPSLPSGQAGTILLNAAIAWCESYCGRKFDRANVSAELGRSVRDDAPDEIRHIVYLARPPATGVTSLLLNEVEIASELYELISDGGRAERVLIKTYEDVPGYGTKVSYTGGWTDGDAPAVLTQAVATLMARMRSRTLHSDIISEASGGESASYMGANQMYDDIRLMLKPYKLMRL